MNTRTAIATLCRPFTAALGQVRPRVRILMYHRVAPLAAPDQLNVSPARFERQMAALARSHRVIDLATLVRELASGEPVRPGVAVTFDDGYLDNLQHALPILQKHHIPATIFVTSRFCAQEMRHPRYAGEHGRLHLDWAEVRALARAPGITIGSHTCTHPHLPRIPREDAWREISVSRAEIEDQLGAPVAHFCYPSGDLTPREVDMVRHAGYAAAVTVAPGGNGSGADAFLLRRTEVTDRDEPRELELKLAGAFDPLHGVLHWKRARNFERARLRGRKAALER